MGICLGSSSWGRRCLFCAAFPPTGSCWAGTQGWFLGRCLCQGDALRLVCPQRDLVPCCSRVGSHNTHLCFPRALPRCAASALCNLFLHTAIKACSWDQGGRVFPQLRVSPKLRLCLRCSCSQPGWCERGAVALRAGCDLCLSPGRAGGRLEGHCKSTAPSQEPPQGCSSPGTVSLWRMKSVCAITMSDFCFFYIYILFFLLETKHHLNHCRGFSLLSQLALPHKSPTQTSFRRRRQHKHTVPAKGRKLQGPRSQAAGCALRIPDLDIKTGILERSTPVSLLSHLVVTELHHKSLRFTLRHLQFLIAS